MYVVCVYVYIYIYIHTHTHMYIHMLIRCHARLAYSAPREEARPAASAPVAPALEVEVKLQHLGLLHFCFSCCVYSFVLMFLFYVVMFMFLSCLS